MSVSLEAVQQAFTQPGIDLRITDWLKKPFESKDLLAKVRRAFNQSA